MNERAGIAGIVLAGGKATRLGGGDKPLLKIGGRPILTRVLERLAPQVEVVALSANGDPARFAEFGLPVLPDEGEQAGPLSGILRGMGWAAKSGHPRLLTVAGDTPFFPTDLAARLSDATAGDDRMVAVATSGGRNHPVFALWPVSLAARLRDFLARSGTFSVTAFLRQHETVGVEFPMRTLSGREVDPFFNINTPEDLAMADEIADKASP